MRHEDIDTCSAFPDGRRRTSRFSLSTLLLLVAVVCLCLSLLMRYGLDIVIPMSFVLGTCLGISVARTWRGSDLLCGALGGAAGYAASGIVLAF
jgi:hypothetical protein